MGRAVSHTYDPATGTWSTKTTTTSSTGGSSSSGGGGSSTPSPQKTDSNLKASTSDKDTSKGSAEQKANTIEINTLEGQLQFIVTEETIKLHAGDTVTLLGLGKYLSGNYYVKSVSRNISRSGYSHSAVVIKTDFGKSLKGGSTTTESGGSDPSAGGGESAKEEVKVASTPQTSTTPQKTYTVKKGDCLWNIAKKEYGAGSDWKKIYDANTGQVVNPNLIYPGQQLVIP